ALLPFSPSPSLDQLRWFPRVGPRCPVPRACRSYIQQRPLPNVEIGDVLFGLETSVQQRRNVVAASMHDDDVAELGTLRAVHSHDNWQPFFDEALTNRLHAHAVLSQPARSLSRITSDKHRDLFGL